MVGTYGLKIVLMGVPFFHLYYLLIRNDNKNGRMFLFCRTPTVFVVDDDPSVRKGLRRLLKSAGYGVETFASAEDFLAFDKSGNGPDCFGGKRRHPATPGYPDAAGI